MNPKQFLKSFQYNYGAFELREQSIVPESVYDIIDDITRLNYRWVESLKTLWYWLPIIWQDRHWDQLFIYIILQHKLKAVEKELNKGFCVDDEKDAKKVRLCVLLLDRLIQYDYWKNHENWKDEERMIQQDLDLLFNTLRKHIQKWWT